MFPERLHNAGFWPDCACHSSFNDVRFRTLVGRNLIVNWQVLTLSVVGSEKSPQPNVYAGFADQCHCWICRKKRIFLPFLANFVEVEMRRKRRIFQQSKIQGYPLMAHINPHHPLVELAAMIDWEAINRVAAEPFLP